MVASEIKVTYTHKQKKSERTTIRNSEHAVAVLRNYWNKATIELQETFKVLYLNRASEVLGIYDLSTGGGAGTVVDGRLLFGVAVKIQAHRIILCHNHPSGSLKPSKQDLKLTEKLMLAARLFDMEVTDHIILTKEAYMSFQDEGEMPYVNDFITTKF